MRVSMIAVSLTVMANPAYAGGFFDDVTRSMNQTIERAARDAGHSVEKGASDSGKIIEREVKGTGKVISTVIDGRSLLHDLHDKADDELIFLTMLPDLCATINCHGVPSDIARQAVGIVRTQKQTEVDLNFRKYQAWAAIFSATFACLSLIVSMFSFARSGRRDTEANRPSTTTVAQPQPQQS